MRVPTWLPCRLQIYCNGHNWLAAQLSRRHIGYRLLDNAFVEIQDWRRAQRLADRWRVQQIHKRLDPFARRFGPISGSFQQHYHCSINQAEYASDIVLRRQAELGAIYENLTRSAIHAVKPDNIATFLGRQLHGNYQGEMGNRFNIRIEATRLKHTLGAVSLKLYDKFGLILRLETTVNDVSFFKHHREVEHRNGIREKKWEPRRKSSCGLPAPCKLVVRVF